MKKLLGISLVIAACTIGAVQANNQQSESLETRSRREESATAVDTLSALLKGDRGIFEDAYDKIEQTLDPKTHKALLALEQEVITLHHKREKMIAIGEFDEKSKEIKKIDKEMERVNQKLKNLMRNGGALHWRSLFALGMGVSMSIFAYRVSSGWYSKPKRAILTLITVTVVLEFLMRGRHAVAAGWAWRGSKELFKLIKKGIKKLLGDTGAADQAMSFLEEQFRPVSKPLDEFLSGSKGPIFAALITVVTLSAVLYATWDSKDKEEDKGTKSEGPEVREVAATV